MDNVGGVDLFLDLGVLIIINVINWVFLGIDEEDYYKFFVGENSVVSLNLIGLIDVINFNFYNSVMEEIVLVFNDENIEMVIVKNLILGNYLVEISYFWGNGIEYNFVVIVIFIFDNVGNDFDVVWNIGVVSVI